MVSCKKCKYKNTLSYDICDCCVFCMNVKEKGCFEKRRWYQIIIDIIEHTIDYLHHLYYLLKKKKSDTT